MEAKNLPAEIVDLILEELVHEAHPAAFVRDLRACALVSRTFCVQAYRRLFSELKVTFFLPHASISESQVLLNLLKTSSLFPVLAMVHHIKSVSFVMEFQDWRHSREDCLLDTNFPDILDLLRLVQPCISEFSLDFRINDNNGQRSGDWSLISPNFLKAFHDLCSSPSLTTLRLKHFLNVPRSILRGSHLKHLELQVIHFLDDPPVEVDPVKRYGVMQLESLELPTYWLLPTVLAVLEGNVKPALEFNDRLQLAFAHLTELTITVITHNRPVYLSLMPQLRSLRLHQSFIYTSHPRQVIQPIVDFFSRSQNIVPNSLLHLLMEVKASYSLFVAGLGIQESQQTHTFLPAFDSLLSGDNFKKVRDIQLVIRIQSWNKKDDELRETLPLSHCRDHILKGLPRLTEVGKKHFHLHLEFND